MPPATAIAPRIASELRPVARIRRRMGPEKPIHERQVHIPDNATVISVENGGLLCRFQGDNGLGTLRGVDGSPEEMFGKGGEVQYFRLGVGLKMIGTAGLTAVTPQPWELPQEQLALC